MKLNGILIMSKEAIFLRELRGLFAKHNIQIISTEYDVDDERENSYRLTNHEVGEDDGIDLDVSDIMARCWVVQEYPISIPKIS